MKVTKNTMSNIICLVGGKLVHTGNEVRLIDAAGKLIHSAKNDGSDPRANEKGVLPQQSGWVAYAHWYNSGGSPIKSFVTTWTVPPAPRTYHGQTVFLFNSIEPASFNAILQPVLQYGPSAAGGSAYWTVASWYVVGSQAYYTKLARVAVGQSLQGVITLTGSTSGGKYNYVSSFSNVGGTTLTLSNAAQLVWATETLESYNVVTGSDYPQGSTVFSAINIKTTAGTPSVQWTPVSDSADQLSTTVNVQGATGAKVTIKYPS